MPNPFVMSAFSLGATVADYALGKPLDLWSSRVDVGNTPEVRAAAWAANRLRPNIPPGVSSLIDAWRRGFITANQANWSLRMQGVYIGVGARPGHAGDVVEQEYYDDMASVWGGVRALNTSMPGPDVISQLYVTGRIDANLFERLAQNVDADWLKYGEVVVASGMVASEDDLMVQYRTGKITRAAYERGLKKLGWHNRTELLAHTSTQRPPPLNVLLTMYNRGMMSLSELDQWIAASDNPSDTMRDRLKGLAKQIPSVSDLLQFSVRDVWNLDVVARWGYDDEFPYPFQYWLAQQGLDWQQDVIDDQGDNHGAVSWPKAYWRAHWQVISPGQAYQAYRRLRPERLNRYLATIPGLTQFDFADLETVLKVHDYPPAARKWLAAISSQPLRMLQIRRALVNGTRDRDWAYHQLLDLGYIPDDARVSVESWEKDELDKRLAWIAKLRERVKQQTYNEILAGYRDGFLDRQTALQRILDLGINDPSLNAALDVIDSQELRKNLRAYLSAMKRDFLRGEMSAQEALARLAQARVTANAAARYVANWVSLLTLERRSLSTGQILSLVSQGALTPEAALLRLANLGWIGADSAFLVAQAAAKAQHALAAAQQVTLKAGLQQRKQAETAARRSQAALRTAQSTVRRLTPLSALRRWYTLGLKSAGYVQLRLASMGYSADEIQAYLSQWVEDSQLSSGGIGAVADAEAKALKRQTPLSTLKRWYQYGLKPEQWVRERLATIGYGTDAINTYLADWQTNLPKAAPGPQA